MTPLTDDELIALIDDLESDRAERKETWNGSAPEKGRQAVCAFANDLPNHNAPGVLFVGVKDDGSPTGGAFTVTDNLLLSLADIKTDGKIIPPPTLTVAKRNLRGHDVAVVTVWPSDAPPVRLDGRIWIRTGPRRGQATAQDERILNEKRRYKDRSFDTHPIRAATVGELNKSYFENDFLPQAVARDVLDANGRSYEQRLASLGMIASVEEVYPTVAGLMTLGSSPRTWIPAFYIQFLRINGTAYGDPVSDEQEIDGNLETMLRRLDEKLKAHLSVSVDFTSGTTTEVRKSAYPLSALQQLVRNAIMHRSYEGTNAPVRVYWFNDRIEISNPGGPFGSVTVENFGRPGINDYRNPLIASVLKMLGFVQRFGFGIAETRRSLEANGNPPVEFEVQPANVLAIVRAA
ncbi:ATP-binding protein [Sphingobium fuliginis]|uniref:Transcriptional regulator n=1 Tax=Sphingobium fuliginis ATCC 27551 TaxID=1208342 RepID=A0A5B8CA77_SPHSA|nr:ATP-binding protein [Sphingobium fuliginis]QDC36039.1 transcriptional regulator [Sphingobium fuliginis ATCC 27551]